MTDIGIIAKQNMPAPEASQSLASAPSLQPSRLTTHTSYSELWSVIATAIGSIKSNYVDMFANLMQKQTEMYDAYNTSIQGALSKSVSEGSDASHLKFDNTTMFNGFKAFMLKVYTMDCGSVPGWDKMSDTARDNMSRSLQPAFVINGWGAISFNLDNIRSSLRTYPSGSPDKHFLVARYSFGTPEFENGQIYRSKLDGYAGIFDGNDDLMTMNQFVAPLPPQVVAEYGTTANDYISDLNLYLSVTAEDQGQRSITSASYQAWLASQNSAGSALQSNMSSFAQRFSQANSTFDNLNKVLSGVISAFLDIANGVIRAL